MKWIVGAGAAGSLAALGSVTLVEVPKAPGGDAPQAEAGTPSVFRVPLAGAVPQTEAAMAEGDGAIVFCLPQLGPLSERCMTRQQILSRDDRPVDRATATTPRRMARVKMVHPTDFAEPERQVATCTAFASLKSDGWAPLTSADRADETRFLRYCGLMSVAKLATVARTSIFAPEGITAEELASVPDTDWPVFGEAKGEAPAIALDENTPRAWLADTPTLIIRLWDVAHADFDDDGEGERLVFLAARVRGGSAGFAGFSVLDADGKKIRLRPIKWL
ncbi:MAG: hypothetical protein AAF986_01830 [Pseudomonadota bacterium]